MCLPSVHRLFRLFHRFRLCRPHPQHHRYRHRLQRRQYLRCRRCHQSQSHRVSSARRAPFLGASAAANAIKRGRPRKIPPATDRSRTRAGSPGASRAPLPADGPSPFQLNKVKIPDTTARRTQVPANPHPIMSLGVRCRARSPNRSAPTTPPTSAGASASWI